MSRSDLPLEVLPFGLRPYHETWDAMRASVDGAPGQPDQLWITEHPPVYTLGLNGRREHLLCPGEIPVVQTDRGGQVTYHGPGQLVVYVLLDLERAGLTVKGLVQALEQALIHLLGRLGIEAELKPGAPGVYVTGAKIASLGLRIRKGRSYHGLSLNVDMDLEPFSRINPCGFANLPMTSLARLGVRLGIADTARLLADDLCRSLGYARLMWRSPVESESRS